MKSVLKSTSVKSSADIKHVLASLLESYLIYMKELDYHGNISPQIIAAVPNKNDEVNEDLIIDKVDLKDYNYLINFTHVDFISKDKWMEKKISSLYTHRR